MSNGLRHAVLFELSDGTHGLVYAGGGVSSIEVPQHIEQWLPIFEQHKIDVMWAMPNTAFSKHIEWSNFDAVDKDRCKVWPVKPSKSGRRPSFVSIQRKTGRFEKDRYLAFPAHGIWNASDPKDQWFLASPYVLLQTVAYIEAEFGTACLWGPGNIGMQGLRRIHERKKWNIENLVLTDQLRDIRSNAMGRPGWVVEALSTKQRKKKFVHGFDKNGQFLGGAQSVMLGDRQPVTVEGSAFDPKTIGMWRVEVTNVSKSVFDGYKLYCPLFDPSAPFKDWASTDLVVASQSVGIELDILEGAVWATGKKYLQDWAVEEWKHRANLRDLTAKYTSEVSRENALGTAKYTANMLMGRLADKDAKTFFRPDWNDLIIHRAIANQVYSHNKMIRDYKTDIVLVTTDTFWVLSDEPDPSLAIPGILEHSKEQRGFKHVGTAPMTKELISTFKAGQVSTISAYLKAQGEQ